MEKRNNEDRLTNVANFTILFFFFSPKNTFNEMNNIECFVCLLMIMRGRVNGCTRIDSTKPDRREEATRRRRRRRVSAMAILTFREPNKNRWIYFTSFIYIYLYIYIYLCIPTCSNFQHGESKNEKSERKEKKTARKGTHQVFFFLKDD